MEQIIKFLKPELLILIFVLYFIGMAIKKSKAKDKYIPFILGACGIFLAILYVVGTSDIANYKDAIMAVFVAITQGILAAGCSVYVNQLIKQTQKTD